jgi:hypothetical protein
MALAFGLVLIGCPDPNKEEADSWTEVTTVNELAGTWKGSGKIPVPAQDAPLGDEDGPVLSIPAFSAGVEMTCAYTADASTVNVTVKIDLKNFLDAMSKTINDDPQVKVLILMGLASSGVDVEGITSITKDHLWTMMGDPAAEKYYQTMDEIIDKDEILSTDEPVYINQNKTKIKFVLPKEALESIGSDKDIEFVLEKQ